MTAPYLPEDCIYNILKYLQNSHSTLFICLLVNRFWCKATVPLLYADPFNRKIVYGNYPSTIPTLISCFSKEEILQFRNQLKLVDKIDKITINDEYKPLFEYPKYIENFDSDKIKTEIFIWSGLLLDSYRREKLQESFIPTFYHSILCRIISIKHLNISLDLFKNWNVLTNLMGLISLKLNLNDLSDFSATKKDFLINISNNCLNLRILQVNTSQSFHNIDVVTIGEVIQKQNNLKAIIISSCWPPNFLNNILLSLEFQKHSLVYIEFKTVNFHYISFKNFINLYNLKYLTFCNCDSKMIPLDQCETLKYASFQLKKLEIKNDGLNRIIWNNDHITSLMIQYLGTSLQELILLPNELNMSIIEDISIHCLNLIKLRFKIRSNISLSTFFTYFKNLKFLRNLNIVDETSYLHDISIFESMASNLPTNIKEVSLDYVNFPCFRRFLENCHNCLEVINYNYYAKLLDLLKIILNYIERSNNSLKVLGIELEGFRKMNMLSDEELGLLDQIKTKGVRIVHYVYDKNDDIDF